MSAADGFGTSLAAEAPTAAATVIMVFPFLKDILGMFGVVDAGSKPLSKRLGRRAAVGRTSSACLYIGGMLELFFSSPKREAVFLSQRKGFVKLALREGADLVPAYLFGNTTVLSTLHWSPLVALSRSLGVSVTLFWGRWWLPVPKPVKLVYARGRPLGLPRIENPTTEDVDKWHAVYCEKLLELFDNYKWANPDYKHKKLEIV
jgi:2-acylglycerol O-acyltransferase 2